MTRRQLTSPSEQEPPVNRADGHHAARGATTVVTPGLGAARPTPPVLAAHGGAWITTMQRSAGNEAVARLMSTTRPRPQRLAVAPRAETIAVRAEDLGSNVVQRGGPGTLTKADQQIEIDLHPEPRAAGQPKTPGWRSMSLKGGTQIVYILADSKTGEALKVGKTTRASFKARFAEYVSAGNKWGRRLKVTMFTIRQRSSKTINAFEAEIRAGMERAGFRLPWDNTNGRLGRTGKGIPVPQSMSGVELIDTVEARAAAAKPSLAPPSPGGAPPAPRVPIASGPATRTPIAAGGSSTPPDVVPPRVPIATGPTRTPTKAGPSATPPEVVEPPKVNVPRPTGRISGGRMLGTGIKVVNALMYLQMIEQLRGAFAGLGPQVELEGLDPGDFDVGFEIKGIPIGPSQFIDVRVERNIIFRRKFYIVNAYEIA